MPEPIRPSCAMTHGRSSSKLVSIELGILHTRLIVGQKKCTSSAGGKGKFWVLRSKLVHNLADRVI
eukprot:238212-Pleurochrysis_carterae.AAC.1